MKEHSLEESQQQSNSDEIEKILNLIEARARVGVAPSVSRGEICQGLETPLSNKVKSHPRYTEIREKYLNGFRAVKRTTVPNNVYHVKVLLDAIEGAVKKDPKMSMEQLIIKLGYGLGTLVVKKAKATERYLEILNLRGSMTDGKKYRRINGKIISSRN